MNCPERYRDRTIVGNRSAYLSLALFRSPPSLSFPPFLYTTVSARRLADSLRINCAELIAVIVTASNCSNGYE